jgi:hypothetical protein
MPDTSFHNLSPHAKDLAEQSLSWSEPYWDPESALLLSSKPGEGVSNPRSIVRNSVWLAVGFLLRNGKGDTDRAVRTLHAIIDAQIDEPGVPYHGTYYRWIGEPNPPGMDAVMWRDFDPNWRQFIGLGLATTIEEYEHRLPADLIERIDRSLELAVIGEPPNRCPPRYTNIALMKAALNVWVGKRLNRSDMVEYGETFGREIYDLFRQTDAYAEYNSPTYYGTNFYALGFWRRYLDGSPLHEWGAYMEAELWRDTAAYYHAGLRNLCGPFSRSYGMDMTRYTALVTLAFWMAFGKDITPFPAQDRSLTTRQGIDHEFVYGSCMAIYDSNAPDDVLESFRTFIGPRRREKQIMTEPDRVATTWMQDDYMLGAESTGGYVFQSYQFHPVTAHWLCENGEVGWLRLKHIGSIDARADEGRVTIAAPTSKNISAREGDSTTFTFEFYAPRLTEGDITADTWRLNGMSVSVKTDLSDVHVQKEKSVVSATYTSTLDTASFELTFRKQ